MKCNLVIIMVMSFCLAALAQGPMPDPPQMSAAPPPPGPNMHMGTGMRMPGLGMGQWWKNSELAQQLKLSDAQVKQIEQSYLDSRLKLIDDNADVQKQETKLQALMDADQFNEQQVTAQIDQLLAARTRLGRDTAMMLVNVRRVLTPDQWKTLQSMRGPGRAMRMERREGMRAPGMRRAPQANPQPQPTPPPSQEQ